MQTEFSSNIPWETVYSQALIDALRPSEHVLQVGFDLKGAATHIQSYHPKQFTIIEEDPLLGKQALKWASQYTNVTVIQDNWENALKGLGIFDAIFFNSYRMEKQDQNTAHQLLLRANQVLSLAEEKIPDLKKMHYSNEDLEEFYTKVGQFHPKEAARFFHELKNNKQISEDQYEQIAQKHSLQKRDPTPQKQIDPMMIFLETALKNHMHKGSRFTSFLNRPTSKFEDPQFFEKIITNSDLNYEEKLLPVTSAKGCDDYPYQEALIILVEKAV